MLELTGLKKNYGEITALDGVSLRVGEGEKVALLGPNGAGKTTLLSIALGLLSPDAGDARLLGRPPREALAAGRVGVLLQDAGLPDDVRVGDLVAAVAGMYPTPSVLADPELEALAGRRVMGLSGGQRQLVRFALALAGDPALLILDEPTVGLDVDARRSLWRRVRDRTVVFATHYLAEADDHADRVVLLSGGRVVADGPVAEMKALVGGTEVRLTLDTMDEPRLRSLPGVHDVLVEGATATLRTGDPDATLRALFAGFGDVRNVRTSEADLESVFVSLTGKGA